MGYRSISIDDRDYLAHRLAWLYVHGKWPPHQLDHINMDRADNRMCNLRQADNAENNCNRPLQSNNTSGFKGVSFHKQTRKWKASLKVRGKDIHLGLFDEAEAAAAAYRLAAQKHFGEFARFN